VVVVGFFLLAATVLSGQPFSLEEAVMLYAVFGGIFPAVAVIIAMQDTLVGEKQNGTASWVLSKPVSRPAFILSKLAAGIVGVAVTMVLVPGIVAYGVLWYGNKSPLPPLTFLLGLGIVLLSLLFYLSLTLMLGAFYNHRGPVIGIALGLLFLQQYIVGLIQPAQYLLPWTMIVPANGPSSAGSLATNLFLGQLSGNWLQAALIALEVVLFSAIAVWRFQKEEL
jgi:ABC-2 type transport system permease protein